MASSIKYSRKTGRALNPHSEIAENFRRALLRLHQQWSSEFEIAFWRKGTQVLCEVQHANGPLDHARVLAIKRRAKRMQSDPAVLIRQKRSALGLTLAEASQRAGMHRTQWNLIELGRRRLTLLSAYKISEALDIPVKDLLLEKPV